MPKERPFVVAQDRLTVNLAPANIKQGVLRVICSLHF